MKIKKIFFISTIFWTVTHQDLAFAQENRDYILKVDFGPNAELADYWYYWSCPDNYQSSRRNFENVFSNEGFSLQISTDCGSDTSCGMATGFEARVTGSINDLLVSDGLRVANDNIEFKFEDLPQGSYDMKLFFHRAGEPLQEDLTLRVIDDRSPAPGNVLSRFIDTSSGTQNPRVSTFNFPLESNGNQELKVQITSPVEGFVINGFQLTNYRYRIFSDLGVELVPLQREDEALISAYFNNGDYFYACQGKDDEGRLHLGWWIPNLKECRYWNEGFVALSEALLVRFDPYYSWQATTSASVDPSGAINLGASSSLADQEFPCLVDVASGESVPGVLKPSESNDCQVYYRGVQETYTNYWLFREK